MKDKFKIVVDFEFNPVKDPEIKPFIHNEIIEIGAVKLDSCNNIVDKFKEYIRPEKNEILPKITRITGISDDTVKDCGCFEEVIGSFYEWAGENSRFYSWSSTDSRVLIDELIFKLGEDTEMLDVFGGHWVDLQRIYQRVMGFHKNMGLSNALGTLMICFKGKEHGALADALNTAEVMKVLYDKEKINHIKHNSSVTYNGNTHSNGGFTMGNLFAEQFAKLGK